VNKIYFIFILLITLLNLNAFSEEYHVYLQEIIKVFQTGSNNNELKYVKQGLGSGDYPGPSAMAFDKDGLFYIADSWNNRIVIYDTKLDLKSIINLNIPQSMAFSRTLYIKGNKIYGNISKSHYNCITTSGKVIFSINLMDYKHYNNLDYNFEMNNDFLIVYLDDGTMISIPEPGPNVEENNIKLFGYEDTKDLFKSESKLINKGFRLDEKNRLFLNGELLTRNYKLFYNYWEEMHKSKGLDNNKIKLSFDYSNLNDMTYLGKDKNENYYWKGGWKWIWIFDKSGFLIEMFEFNGNKSKILPTVHPSGDVYFLDYDEKGVYLYRVKNVWDPEGRAKWYRESGVKEVSPLKK